MMGGVGRSGVELVTVLWDRINAEGLPALRELFTPDYVRHTAGSTIALEEFCRDVEDRRQAFPDMVTTVQDVIAEGQKVAYRWETTGTHLGTYLGVPPTRRVVVARGITISRIEDGRVAEDWASWNKAQVLHLLGVIPIA